MFAAAGTEHRRQQTQGEGKQSIHHIKLDAQQMSVGQANKMLAANPGIVQSNTTLNNGKCFPNTDHRSCTVLVVRSTCVTTNIACFMEDENHNVPST